eukprot:scaffold1963_cov242-Pinguiococcus_pyrenoidosus.AAC.6
MGGALRVRKTLAAPEEESGAARDLEVPAALTALPSGVWRSAAPQTAASAARATAEGKPRQDARGRGQAGGRRHQAGWHLVHGRAGVQDAPVLGAQRLARVDARDGAQGGAPTRGASRADRRGPEQRNRARAHGRRRPRDLLSAPRRTAASGEPLRGGRHDGALLHARARHPGQPGRARRAHQPEALHVHQQRPDRGEPAAARPGPHAGRVHRQVRVQLPAAPLRHRRDGVSTADPAVVERPAQEPVHRHQRRVGRRQDGDGQDRAALPVRPLRHGVDGRGRRHARESAHGVEPHPGGLRQREDDAQPQ